METLKKSDYIKFDVMRTSVTRGKTRKDDVLDVEFRTITSNELCFDNLVAHDARIFMVVAASNCLVDAASKLNESRYSVISSLKALEKVFGCHLYLRNPDRDLLTNHGKELYARLIKAKIDHISYPNLMYISEQLCIIFPEKEDVLHIFFSQIALRVLDILEAKS
jgi:hypothetical protein